MKTISFAITAVDEIDELKTLIPLLLELKDDKDEIVVLFDTSRNDTELETWLEAWEDNIKLFKHEFDGNFSNMKNLLISFCTKDVIFSIDADELIDSTLVPKVRDIFENHPLVDMLILPRENLVTGLEQEHVSKWGWRTDVEGRVNFPDWQTRVFKNNGKILWKGKVHERLNGFEVYGMLPEHDKTNCLIHHKNITRQEKQNSFYDELIKNNDHGTEND